MSQVIIAVIVTGVIVAAITWIVANQHRQKTYEAKLEAQKNDPGK